MRTATRLALAIVAELVAFLRELAGSALTIPGKVRFRMLRTADKAEAEARRIADRDGGSGPDNKGKK